MYDYKIYVELKYIYNNNIVWGGNEMELKWFKFFEIFMKR